MSWKSLTFDILTAWRRHCVVVWKWKAVFNSPRVKGGFLTEHLSNMLRDFKLTSLELRKLVLFRVWHTTLSGNAQNTSCVLYKQVVTARLQQLICFILRGVIRCRINSDWRNYNVTVNGKFVDNKKVLVKSFAYKMCIQILYDKLLSRLHS